MTGFCYRIRLLNYIMELYYRIILRNHITKYIKELYWGIVLQRYFVESYSEWIILRNYVTECTHEKEPRHPRTSPGPLGTLGTPRDSQGAPTNRKTHDISFNLQRQKLSIAASESLRCNASPQRLPWAVLSCMLPEWSPFGPPLSWDLAPAGVQGPRPPMFPYTYINIHIYM